MLCGTGRPSKDGAKTAGPAQTADAWPPSLASANLQPHSRVTFSCLYRPPGCAAVLMSGLEIAGVLLGAFPLIISGLEHWRDVAKVGGFFWRVRKEYSSCRSDVQFYEIVYKRSLRELLLPIVDDAEEVARLIADPGGKDWRTKALQDRLEGRLQESYTVYMDIISEMNEAAEEISKKLCFNKAAVQDKLASPQATKTARPQSTLRPAARSGFAAAKAKWDYESFRLTFSFSDPVRQKLFNQLKNCNDKLEKLLSSSDKVSALQYASSNRKQTSTLESALKNAWKKSDLLFKALSKAWQCSCQQYHIANLRLEHRTMPEICFEIILMFSAPSSHGVTPWSWREMRCGSMIGCSSPQQLSKSQSATSPPPCPLPATPRVSTASTKQRKVAFLGSMPQSPNVPEVNLELLIEPSVRLCKILGDEACGRCIGVIGHEDEAYHLHPFERRKRLGDEGRLTLDYVLSQEFEGHLSRRQRYSIALLLASSVAQLQFTPWLRSGLAKGDVLFFMAGDDDGDIPYGEPFIRQDFPPSRTSASRTDANDCNFYSLAILLLELCFGRRLEDHPLRKKHPTGDADAKQAFDLMAALKWSQSVADEGGDDYASAVKWCFTGCTGTNNSWRGEIIKNVIRPLELCQMHFKTVAIT